MLKSMTGFGKSEVKVNGKKLIVEVKSLNSKQLDVSSFRLPLSYREKEMEIRNLLVNSIQRGKVDFIVTIESEEEGSSTVINSKVFKSYLEQIRLIAADNGLSLEGESLVQSILRLPEVFSQQKEGVLNEELEALNSCILSAIDSFNEFRAQEGKITEDDLIQKVNRIQELLQSISPFEADRVEAIRVRLNENLKKFVSEQSIDRNRFEQEIVYYLEKFDINEEKVRLLNHCNYFFNSLKEDDQVGRKLSFIAQEMGREINTLGSKANHSGIQKIVVQMKDELEKIKEQLLNVL